MKYIFLQLILLCGLQLATAQVKVSIQAPRQAEVGQHLQVSYTVNTQDVDAYDNVVFPGFDLLYGPSTSSNSSFSFINGKSKSVSSITFTYTIVPLKEGKHSIPAMAVTVRGQKYKSSTATIEVLPATPNNTKNNNHFRTLSVGEKMTGKDLFVRVSASKHKVLEQEAIILSYKLYSLVSISECATSMPKLDGFHVQEIKMPQNKSLYLESYKGKNYRVVEWCKYVVYPQKSGKLTIPELPFDVTVIKETIDPFDDFFSGNLSEHHRIWAPAVSLDVSALPNKPEGFSGLVGEDIKINASLSDKAMAANNAVSLRVEISGTGNMRLMMPPKINWPKDFEIYDPKRTDRTVISSEGTTGKMIYNYTVVPTCGGKYALPPIEFIYYDLQTKTYKTLRSESFDVKVTNTPGHSFRQRNRSDINVLNDDIRYIMTGNRGVFLQGDRFFSSIFYGFSYLLCGLFSLLAYYILSYSLKQNAQDHVRHAGKIAAKRLKKARKLQETCMREEFYDEVMRALWGFLGDKLNLQADKLNKEHVGKILTQRGVNAYLQEALFSVIENCEFARYAPSNSVSPMEQTIIEATEVINKLNAKL